MRRLDKTEILSWLREQDATRLEMLWQEADRVRQKCVGDEVHLRGLLEISNHCVRQCAYCGLHAANTAITRYRMDAAEILACAREIAAMGYGTVVIQAGEDYGLTGRFIADVVRQIKSETPLAVTLSLGERSDEELCAWREAGADRYLLRFETSNIPLFNRIHPPLKGRHSDRIAMLRRLRQFGYEIGSGFMAGLPGQTCEFIADDILLLRDLDMDMIGIGPYIPHPATPLGGDRLRFPMAAEDQAPAVELLVYKAVALVRLACPEANIPSTTALATINKKNGRELGLRRGANIVMPNFTPLKYRRFYEIYPAKACVDETGTQCHSCLGVRIASIGRIRGAGPGGRRRNPHALNPADPAYPV
jgi:biotin synthase